MKKNHETKMLDESTIKNLVSILYKIEKTEKINVKPSIIKILFDFDVKKDEVIDAFIYLLKNDKDDFIKSLIAKHLGDMGVENNIIIDALLLSLIYDKNYWLTRINAIESLAKLNVNTPEVVDALFNLFKEYLDYGDYNSNYPNTDLNNTILEAISESLREFKVKEHNVIDCFIDILTDKDNKSKYDLESKYSRAKAITALGILKINTNKIISALSYSIDNEIFYEVQMNARKSLLKIQELPII